MNQSSITMQLVFTIFLFLSTRILWQIKRSKCNDYEINNKWIERFSQQMGKIISVTLYFLIAGIQAIHFALIYKGYKFSNQIDDSQGTPYGQYNSQTTSVTYDTSFYSVASGITAIAYILLGIFEIVGYQLQPKVKYILGFAAALFQFTLAVEFSIDVSSGISPNSPNAGATQKQSNYVTLYWLELSDAVITWVICVPGTSFLLLFVDSEAKGNEVEQHSSSIHV